MQRTKKARRPADSDGYIGDVTWENAIQQVLAEAGSALHYSGIGERIAARGLRKSVGATPAATVAASLSKSLSEGSSPFLRAGKVEYTRRDMPTPIGNAVDEAASDADNPAEAGALRAFGIFWVRDAVMWNPKPKMLGRQGTGATDVNLAAQVGVYRLHDRERVIYEGCAEDTMFARLKAHIVDRLGGRWDRFFWFGLRSVRGNGALSDDEMPWNQNVVVETMEVALIESLELPLNRKQRDNLSGIDYIQASDPLTEGAKKKGASC